MFLPLNWKRYLSFQRCKLFFQTISYFLWRVIFSMSIWWKLDKNCCFYTNILHLQPYEWGATGKNCWSEEKTLFVNAFYPFKWREYFESHIVVDKSNLKENYYIGLFPSSSNISALYSCILTFKIVTFELFDLHEKYNKLNIQNHTENLLSDNFNVRTKV